MSGLMEPERLASLMLAHESIKDRSEIDLQTFLEVTKDWEVFPALHGAILRRGPEIHACIKPDGFGRWFNKSARQVLNETIEKHGHAITRVTEGNRLGDAFVRRLGFWLTHTENGVWVYRKENHGS